MTPEAKVKAQVKRMLHEIDPTVYEFSPVTGGYGRSGVPDIVVCLKGKFIGIECKANGGKPTELQKKNLRDICDAGGYAIAVDEHSLGIFKMIFKDIVMGATVSRYWDMTASDKTPQEEQSGSG